MKTLNLIMCIFFSIIAICSLIIGIFTIEHPISKGNISIFILIVMSTALAIVTWREYKNIIPLLLLLGLLTTSCGIINSTQTTIDEDKPFQANKYAGRFISDTITKPEKFGNPWILWIKTDMQDTYGIISAYSRKCEFLPGEHLYIRRVYLNPGLGGYWAYQIKGITTNKFYKLSKFQYGNKTLTQTWF